MAARRHLARDLREHHLGGGAGLYAPCLLNFGGCLGPMAHSERDGRGRATKMSSSMSLRVTSTGNGIRRESSDENDWTAVAIADQRKLAVRCRFGLGSTRIKMTFALVRLSAIEDLEREQRCPPRATKPPRHRSDEPHGDDPGRGVR